MFQIIASIVLVLLTFKNISERSLTRTLSAKQIFQEGDIRETSSDILIQYLPENSRLLLPLYPPLALFAECRIHTVRNNIVIYCIQFAKIVISLSLLSLKMLTKC